MDKSITMSKSIVLPVGGDFHLKTGKDHIIYAGMLSDNIYSIAQKKANGYQGYSWNLFYPRKRQDIIIDGIKVFVERVTPEEIELRVL
jgi:hypothetical protein